MVFEPDNADIIVEETTSLCLAFQLSYMLCQNIDLYKFKDAVRNYLVNLILGLNFDKIEVCFILSNNELCIGVDIKYGNNEYFIYIFTDSREKRTNYKIFSRIQGKYFLVS